MKPAQLTALPWSRLCIVLAALSAILVATGLVGLVMRNAHASTAAAALGSNWYGSAPYDMPLDEAVALPKPDAASLIDVPLVGL